MDENTPCNARRNDVYSHLPPGKGWAEYLAEIPMAKISIGKAVELLKHTIGMFAQSQGFYGRLYANLEEGDGWKDMARAALADGVNLADDLEIVMWLEC